MSRVGKNPVALPQGVEVSVTAQDVSVKGPLGTICLPMISMRQRMPNTSPITADI